MSQRIDEQHLGMYAAAWRAPKLYGGEVLFAFSSVGSRRRLPSCQLVDGPPLYWSRPTDRLPRGMALLVRRLWAASDNRDRSDVTVAGQ